MALLLASVSVGLLLLALFAADGESDEVKYSNVCIYAHG